MYHLLLSILSVFVIEGFLVSAADDYDYIIVGASAAGCVLANRLSDGGSQKVLLLEAGGEPTILSQVPAFAIFAYFTNNRKDYFMEKQDSVGLGLIDQRISAARGRGLGGSTIIDDLVYFRGNKAEYDKWGSLGNSGWSFEQVLPYFKRLENTRIPHIDTSIRGVGGNLDVSSPETKTESVRAFIQAVRDSGLNIIDDYNDGDPTGIGYIQATIKNGRRANAATAYINPARRRHNLDIKTGCLVTKVIINPDTKLAEGVRYESYGQSHTVYAKKEVILSAGGIGSPHLLLLSGVGPRQDLAEVGISNVADLPVGKVLEDHFQYPNVVIQVNQSITPNILTLANPLNVFEWAFKGTGLLSIPAVILEAVGNINIDPEGLNEVSLFFGCGSLSTDYGVLSRRVFRVGDGAYKQIYKQLEGKHAFTVYVVLVHPVSRGYLKLRTSNPRDNPLIFGNFLSDARNEDVKSMIKAIRIVQKIITTPAMQKYAAKQILTPTPGCEQHATDSDDFWECQLRHIGMSDWQPVATCKMGPDSDPEAVVDGRFRVKGVRNLRVIDASVIPFSLTGKNSPAAYMLGERGSDFILESEGPL